MARSILYIADILEWAKEFHKCHGRWPVQKDGRVAGKDFTWTAVDAALRKGCRGLPGGSSLRRLLRNRCGHGRKGRLPDLTIRQILAWADSHFQRTKKWPHSNDKIYDAPGETWLSVHTVPYMMAGEDFQGAIRCRSSSSGTAAGAREFKAANRRRDKKGVVAHGGEPQIFWEICFQTLAKYPSDCKYSLGAMRRDETVGSFSWCKAKWLPSGLAFSPATPYGARWDEGFHPSAPGFMRGKGSGMKDEWTTEDRGAKEQLLSTNPRFLEGGRMKTPRPPQGYF